MLSINLNNIFSSTNRYNMKTVCFSVRVWNENELLISSDRHGKTLFNFIIGYFFSSWMYKINEFCSLTAYLVVVFNGYIVKIMLSNNYTVYTDNRL